MIFNYEKLLNIPTIYEASIYTIALKKIFDYISFIDIDIQKSIPHKQTTFNLAFNEERLEFLGDGFLQSVITELIFETFPNATHGSLSSLRSRLVRNSTLALIVQKMNLVESILLHLNLNPEEYRPITLKNAADSFESIIGASFIDRGYQETRSWIRKIYANYDLITLFLDEDNFLDILQIYTKSSLPTFNYKNENQTISISTMFRDKYYETSNKLKQKAKQELVKKIVMDLIDDKLIPRNILVLRGCGKHS